MNFKPTKKFAHKISCAALISMFFIPLSKKALWSTTLAYTSPYVYATGGNWLTSEHKFAWLLIIAPLVMLAISFLKLLYRTRNEIVVGACGAMLITLWAMTSTEKIIITYVIYIALMIVTALTGIKNRE